MTCSLILFRRVPRVSFSNPRAKSNHFSKKITVTNSNLYQKPVDDTHNSRMNSSMVYWVYAYSFSIYIAVRFFEGGAFYSRLYKLVAKEKNEPLTISRLALIFKALFECLVSVPFLGLFGGFFIFAVPSALLLIFLGYLIGGLGSAHNTFSFDRPLGWIILFTFPLLSVEIIGKLFNIKKNF